MEAAYDTKKCFAWPVAEAVNLSALVNKYPAGFRYVVNTYLSDDYLTYTAPLSTIHYLGTVNRNVNYSQRFDFDHLFALYLSNQNIDFRANSYTRGIPKHMCGYLSIKKYDIPQPVLSADDWAVSGFWAIDKWQPYCGNSDVCSWEFEITALKKQTSPGAPWNMKYRTKAQALRDDRVLDFIGKEWVRSKTEPLSSLFVYNNKEEVRTLEKVHAGKLRGFTGADLVFVMCCDRICRTMNEKFYDSNLVTPNCVGLCKFRRGWDKLYRKLSKHPNAFELDESSYDASLFRAAMFGMVHWRFAMLSDQSAENAQRLLNYYTDIVDSYIILTRGEVVRKHTGNPSGSPNTIVDNTVILYRLLVYAFRLCYKRFWHAGMPKQQKCTMAYMDANVEMALGGDDNTFTVSDEIVGWFNARNISEIWSEIGVVTHAPHDVGIMEYEARRLEECHFFSMSFTKIRNTYVPVPNAEKMQASMLFAGKHVGEPIWSLLRACAVRIETFYDTTMRKIMMGYIQYLLTNYRTQLLASKDPTFDQVMTVFKSDDAIEALYLGYESTLSPDNDKKRSPRESEPTIIDFTQERIGLRNALQEEQEDLQEEGGSHD